MTDLEFDVLDELYFVQTFAELREALDDDIAEDILAGVLYELTQKSWVKCLHPNKDEPIAESELDVKKSYKQYCYLATKAGLMAHNMGS